MSSFDLVVEGRSIEPYNTVTQPELHLVNLTWEDDPPDIVIMPGGLMLIKTGKYLTRDNKYSYRVATVAKLVAGRLVKD
jgi:hypothetical protein